MNWRVLVDENLPSWLPRALRAGEVRVAVAVVGEADSPPKGTSDAGILLWCEEHNYVLITNNRRSMPKHLLQHLERGGHIPGILTVNLGRAPSDILDGLTIVFEASLPEEYCDRIEFLNFT